MPDSTSPKPTTLYRLADKNGKLLYVGIAGNVGRRMAEHERYQPWWLESTFIRLEHFPDRPAAEKAELKAIRTEFPVYNKAGVHKEPAEPRYIPTPDIKLVEDPDLCSVCERPLDGHNPNRGPHAICARCNSAYMRDGRPEPIEWRKRRRAKMVARRERRNQDGDFGDLRPMYRGGVIQLRVQNPCT